jgi:predicted nucleic acid-binding protein
MTIIAFKIALWHVLNPLIAFAYDRSVYDCLYVALAVQSKTDLITADERLANALAARFRSEIAGCTVSRRQS